MDEERTFARKGGENIDNSSLEPTQIGPGTGEPLAPKDDPGAIRSSFANDSGQ